MYYLGISAFYHDSAAVLLKDGKVVVAIEEERLSRRKHDNSFPKLAVEYCLNHVGITINEIDCIAYYEKPLKKLERIIETFVKKFPWGAKAFIASFAEQLTRKLLVEKNIRKDLKFSGRIFYSSHHLSHAAAAYYPSPFTEAAVLTIDGVGEYETIGLWLAKNDNLRLLKSIEFPHSLGLWYSTFTSFLGFRVNDDEYKVMGMAAYGVPKYFDEVMKTINVKDDGSFALSLEYFSFESSSQMWSKKFVELFGEPRTASMEILTKHFDIAASIQKVFEDIYLKIINQLKQDTGESNLCIGGGVALNAKANGLITENSDFKNLYIFGASGDSGAALGAALYAWHKSMPSRERETVTNLCWGKNYSPSDIEVALESYRDTVSYTKFSDTELVEILAKEIIAQKVVGYFCGGSEFGPRALGHRSLLASADNSVMKDKLNDVKGREHFRPFGGVVIKDDAKEYFAIGNDKDLPFMNICKLALPHSNLVIPALIHEDGSTRVQTVSESDGLIFDLLRELKQKAKPACLINTSFNMKGQPIVETPTEALELFVNSAIDVLVLDSYLVYRK